MAPLKGFVAVENEEKEAKYPWLKGHGSIEGTLILRDQQLHGGIHG